MKMNLNRKIATLMTVVLVLSFLFNMNAAVASAASPTFATKSIDLVGEGKTYQMEIKNKVANSTYSWTTSNKKIAKVSSKGLITAVSGGSTTIKCKITYPTKKTTTLSCKVTVTIPATAILINNKKLVNGAHVMKLGSTMDFNCDLTPANSSDKVFWSIGGGDTACIRIDNEKEGKITAVKPGKVILRATAAKTATAADAAMSFVNDAVIVEVVGLTASVMTAGIIDTNKLVVEFDSPVDKSTVIATDGSLSGNIEVTVGRNLKNVLADDPGKLTPSLSADGKTLTITSEKRFNGNYGIYFSGNIRTTDGIALDSDYKVLTYLDTTAPDFLTYTIDDTGRIVTIQFTEPMDFSNMRITNATLVTTAGGAANPSTLSILKNAAYYTVSEDKQSLTIDLSLINVADYGKTFSVTFFGLKDLQGNEPTNHYIIAYVATDKDNRPQARCYSIERTGKKTLTAYFDRELQSGGLLQIAGGSIISGVVDTKDKKKVNYTISDAEALYTGVKTVSIRSWNSYNVYPSDTTANNWYTFPVDFTTDVTSPALADYKYDASTSILTLIYNKAVTLTVPTGAFTAKFASVTEDIIPNVQLTYTNIAHTEGNHIIKLRLLGLSTQAGIYSFTINQGFVTDSFDNKSVQFPILIDYTSGTLTELPAPFYIAQNPNNLSQIIVKYAYKVDQASATTIANYVLPGIEIKNADLTENTPTSATVTLTLAEGAIKQEMDYPIRISGVKGHNNTYTAITEYVKYDLHLKENVKPTFTNAEFDRISKNNIKITFSEAITGTMQFEVRQIVGATNAVIPVSTVNIVGNSIVILLPGVITNNTQVTITILSNNITDLSGNKLEYIPGSIPLYVTY